ncbi:hypothetical protein [Alkalicoccobacillus plakortidis]|uniref:Uncharacterized protein n=1 Tax=Alkalicoccobacillus plakortidis TaxID=444060 RepID=A0ABT0XHM0_9BACI|nr:hypothetical protein [Alkalicoccobacillus plakortidis]MCM2675367.1 hypothetical protein [Alkalicoccobacillus plakortidis]
MDAGIGAMEVRVEQWTLGNGAMEGRVEQWAMEMERWREEWSNGPWNQNDRGEIETIAPGIKTIEGRLKR